MSKKFVTALLNLILAVALVPICWIAYSEGGKVIGIRPIPVEVEGTGSMYPSLFWDKSQGGPEDSTSSTVAEYRSTPLMYRVFGGLSLAGQTYFKTTIGRGDMVAFQNQATKNILKKEGKDQNLGFIKRVVGLPGDTIELRDGYVIRNGEQISEPYIRSARSTYGGSTLAECTPTTVPPHSLFVLGDNRKVSSDSRFELGMIDQSDVDFVLPLAKQTLYHPLWRDTSGDSALSGKPTLDPKEFYQKIPRLKVNPKLANSALLRGQALLKNPETKYDLASSLKDAGYNNVVTGEFVIYGHYTADEIWENLQNNYDTKNQLINPDYTEIGLAAVTGATNGCPTQVIVGHLGGYVPANYSSDVISSWTSARDSLNQVIPSWESAVGNPGVDQDKLAKLLELLRVRQRLVNDVLDVMNKRDWISDQLSARMDQDSKIASQAEELAKELNGQ